MANDRDIKIGIETTADTTGAQQSQDAINRLIGVEEKRAANAANFLTAAEAEVAEVNRMVRAANALSDAKAEEARAIRDAADAAWKEQAQLDIIEAKRRLAARAVTQQTTEIKNLGMVATQVGYQVTDFATQVSMGTSVVTAFAQQAPQAIAAFTQFGAGATSVSQALSSTVSTGTVLSLVLTELAIGTKLVIDEYSRMTSALKAADDAQKRYRETVARVKQMEADLYKDRLIGSNAGITAKEADDTERLIQALERKNALQSARGQTAAAQAQAAIAQARNSGGDVASAQAGAIEVQVVNQINSLDSKLTESEAKVNKLNETAENLFIEMDQIAKLKGRFSDQFIEAEKAYNAADAAANKAQLDLENERAIIAEEKRQLQATIESSVSDLKASVSTNLVTSLQDAKSEIESVSSQQGGELSASARIAYQKINQILADGIVSDAEINQVAQTLQLLKSSNEQVFAQVFTGVDRLISVGLTSKQRMDTLEKRIADLEQNQ